MSKSKAGTSKPPPFSHGPRAAKRQPPGSFTPEFLRQLKAQGSVHQVPEGWDHNIDNLPPGAAWVIYPNGDLERVWI